ncbi:30S ribosomal protein S3ae [Aeropyrum pernix]|uniref:Small ribosomal subunit protein eS1 n=1 Tax=Aeropyrum pernix TaxID=56636 RepID=A0A401H7L8_AERPX|nr:30S ribosomal protein S3ae [Aeropyrum pernix]
MRWGWLGLVRGGIRDTWRLKKWFKVVAPPLFGETVLGTTPADDPDKLIGRVMETTLFDITGDYSYVHVKMYFQVVRVEGDTAYTRFKGHELLRDYIRGLTRRKSSKVTGIFNVWTKDGYGLRVTAMAFTRQRCKTSQKSAIRKVMQEVVEQKARESTLDELIQLMVFSDHEGSLAYLIDESARKIYPLRKVEIAKSKLLWVPGPNGPEKAVVVSPLQLKAT